MSTFGEKIFQFYTKKMFPSEKENIEVDGKEKQSTIFKNDSKVNVSKYYLGERRNSEEKQQQQQQKLPGTVVKTQVRTGNNDAKLDTKTFTKPRFDVYKDDRINKNRHRSTDDLVAKNPKTKRQCTGEQKKLHPLLADLSEELAIDVDDIDQFMSYQASMHDRKKLSDSFLSTQITPYQRRYIVKYLIRCVAYNKYPSMITYQAVRIFESYVDVCKVRTDEMQIAALAALWIAIKKDLITNDIPDATTFLERLTPNNESPKILMECEQKILKELNFEITFADPQSILVLCLAFVVNLQVLETEISQKLHYCGSYFVDLSLLNDKTFSLSPVVLAILSAEIALWLVLSPSEDSRYPRWTFWKSQILDACPDLAKYCLSDDKSTEIIDSLLRAAISTNYKDTDFYIVFKKYNTKRYGRVSHEVLKKINLLFDEK